MEEELNFKNNIPKWINEDRAFDVYLLKVNINHPNRCFK